MSTDIPTIFAGVSIGSILMLVALGLTFTFGQMSVINMAHGEFLMAGAYTTYVLQDWMGEGSAGTAFMLGLPAAFLVAGSIGLVLERALISRLYGREIDTLLVTFGVSLVLQQLARDVFGAPNVNVSAPSFLRGGVELFGETFSRSRLFVIALAAIAVVAAQLTLTFTRYGRRSRAVTQNRQLAAASGLRTERTDAATFFLGSGLAGVAGAAITLLGSIGPTLGSAYIVDAFLVVIAGGLGHLRGMVVVAIGVGLLNSHVELWSSSSTAKVVVFMAIIAFLQVRPQGLVALRTRSIT